MISARLLSGTLVLLLTFVHVKSAPLPWGTNTVPLAVWLQSPRNAAKFKAAGINLYVGLWNGPTAEQLAALTQADMPVVCAQTTYALQQKDNPIIAGWMHDDEPDNAQSLGRGQGYGPPITPEVIQEGYHKMREADPSRPVLLNLGQAVAWDNYIGRGVRRNHPEDYPEYLKGCDIASFDIYPVVHDNREIAGRLEYIARGVERLKRWTGAGKDVWNCIECTHIGNPAAKASPEQIRSEVWMSLIHGSRGLIYFVHQFKPSFKEAALLDDPETLAAVTRINAEVQALAPVIFAPEPSGKVNVTTSMDLPVATLYREVGGTNYLFTVGMRPEAAHAVFRVPRKLDAPKVEVIGENRFIAPESDKFSDEFTGYAVHLYRW